MKVRPLTAIAIAIIVVTVSFGIGKFVFPFKIPFFEYNLKDDAIKIIESKRDTAFIGTLRHDLATDKYYLIIDGSEAITLEVPATMTLDNYIGKRIFATGTYIDESRSLTIKSATDVEVLPTKTQATPTKSETDNPNPLSVIPSLFPKDSSTQATESSDNN